MMALPQQSSRFFLRRLNLGTGFCLHHDRIHSVGIGLLHTDHFPLGGGNWKQNDIVLVLPLGRLTFPREHADDRERDILNTEYLADWVGAIEQVIDRSLDRKSTR